LTLLVLASLLTLAWILSVALARIRVPDILGFLALGVLFGPVGLHALNVSFSQTGIGTGIAVAASVLLYEGGRGLDFAQLRPAWRGLMFLVTGGVVITAGLSAAAAHAAFAWDWQAAVLLGVVIACTDPAAVIPVMRQVRMSPRVSNFAQAESALNDATAAILTLVTIEVIRNGNVNAPAALWTLLYMGIGGIVVGVVIAAATAWIAHGDRFRELDLGAHNQQVIELITILLTYVVATHLGTSGYMAAFAAGLVHSRTVSKAPYSTQPFFSTASFLARLAVFVLLGATFDPRAAAVPVAATVAFVAVFMFVVRPLVVFGSLLPDRRPRWTIGELLMLSWVRETGVIPAALAANIAALALPNAAAIVAKTTAVIIVTVIVQGVTTGPLARRLRLTT
jgi:cell volume regulation protein A